MKLRWLPLLNPVRWVKAWLFHRRNKQFSKSQSDPELHLYAQILSNDMLHYGYFEDPEVRPETISIEQIERAQTRYAEMIIEQIRDVERPVLDVGCGMGGLSAMLQAEGLQVEALTPNKHQKKYFDQKHPDIPCYHMKFEALKPGKTYGTVINSESLQYIRLGSAFSQVDALLEPGGRWVVTDYFRTADKGINKSGHQLEDFLAEVNAYGWTIKTEKDITANVLPTIRFVNMYGERFLKPVKEFAFEKLRYKQGWLYYLTGNVREAATQKMDKELAAVNPEQFAAEKQYMLFVIEKPDAGLKHGD